MIRLVSYFQIIWFTYGVLLVGCEPFPSNEILVLKAFKEAIYEDPLMVLSNWNFLDEDPCDWFGITCSEAHNHVIALNLSNSSLKGFISPALSQLSSLQDLSLHKNNLLGSIPKELGKLKSLKVLDLGMNQLSGPIPLEFGSLTSVTKINLQSNELIGSLPPGLGNLRNLVELYLERNKLQGNVPGSSNSSFTSNMHGMYAWPGNATGFCRSTQLKDADFSYNFFVGKIPQCLKYLPRSSFEGNCFQNTTSKQRHASECGASPPAESRQGSNLEYQHQHTKDLPKHKGETKPTWLFALEVITGSIVGFILLFALLVAVRKYKGKYCVITLKKKAGNGNRQVKIDIDSDMLNDVVRLSRQELEVACEDFSNIIGSCPDTLVYKGIMKDGSEVAVISLCAEEKHWTSYLELYFQRQVADLARLNHDNTGKILGYCRENDPFSRMIVFEYTSNGTLYEHLHYGEGCQLSWRRRIKLIIGIARGLRYLHTELEPPFTISALNSTSIYLTEDFSPKLVDFERWNTVLARVENKSGLISNGDKKFPESLEMPNQDVHDNVFAFGLILLEIISGRPAYCKDRGNLLDWAKEYVEHPEVISYLVDPELRHFKFDDLKVICEVVKLCILSDPTKRPSMQLTCSMLEDGIHTSNSADFSESSLAWAELAISS